MGDPTNLTHAINLPCAVALQGSRFGPRPSQLHRGLGKASRPEAVGGGPSSAAPLCI